MEKAGSTMAQARDYGLMIGKMPAGEHNRITDVPGVTVGHTTLTDNGLNTGVTVIMPCRENPFSCKLTAACHVLNGFGKTAGLMQIEELGTLETPIALTNTLNVGLVHDAVVEYMLSRCEKEGINLRSVNPVVCECNDASLNHIASRAVRQEHVLKAIEQAKPDFAQGAVGAGRGMTCHGLKGGIGSASRKVMVDEKEYILGVLVLSNHGRLGDLTIEGQRKGEMIQKQLQEDMPDKGSCIVVMATNLPLNDRQIRRVVRRAGVGLARIGSYIGHGSGEVFLGFTTANRVPMESEKKVLHMDVLVEEEMDQVFRAMAESTEEAVLNSMLEAESVTSGDGKTIRHSLKEWMK